MRIQDLISRAPADREEDRFIELKVVVRAHGHESTMWKKVLTWMRHTTLIMGDGFEFFAGNEKLVDDLSDDDGESWHSLDWKGDPELKAKGHAPVPEKVPPSQWMGGGLEITYPPIDGHPPFPPAWDGDTHKGHHRSCAVRVKHACSCGYEEFCKNRAALEQELVDRKATLESRTADVDRDLRELRAGYQADAVPSSHPTFE